MNQLLILAIGSMAVLSSIGSAVSQQTQDSQRAVEEAIPPTGTTRLTDAAYRRIQSVLDSSRRKEPQTEWMASLIWTDIRSARSPEAARKEEWSEPLRTWVLGTYRRANAPDQYFETIRGLKILVVYGVEQWRRTERRIIDFQNGRFVNVGSADPASKPKG